MKDFSIVEFPQERTVDVVPASWVEEGECWWPPVDQKQLLQDKNAVPDKKSWRKHKARIIKSYDTYKEALKKMKKGKYTLSFDTSGCESGDNFTSPIFDSDFENETPDLLQVQLPTYGILGTSICENSLELDSEMPLANNSVLGLESFEKKFIRFSEIILKKVEKLSDDIKEVKEMMTMCVSQVNPECNNTDILTIPTLPIASVDALNEIQEWLQNSENLRVMITYLAKKGGSNCKQMTRRLLQCCITNALATSLNWTGKFNKIAFEDHMLVKAILSAVQLIHNCTDAEVETIIKNWLRFAKDRDGGRDARRINKLL